MLDSQSPKTCSPLVLPLSKNGTDAFQKRLAKTTGQAWRSAPIISAPGRLRQEAVQQGYTRSCLSLPQNKAKESALALLDSPLPAWAPPSPLHTCLVATAKHCPLGSLLAPESAMRASYLRCYPSLKQPSRSPPSLLPTHSFCTEQLWSPSKNSHQILSLWI